MICRVYDCKHNYEGDCQTIPTISNDTLTASGFLPVCEDYEESEENEYVE